MRNVILCMLVILFLAGCDDNRTYQEYSDFEHRYWLSNVKPEFEFEVDDPTHPYNLYFNVRNSTTYPYSRLFVTYYLQDSTGREIKKELISQLLFDVKTGKPHGKSGLGDLFDQEFLIMKNHQFKEPGKYKMKFEQFMRTDTLQGILSVGLRVEKSE